MRNSKMFKGLTTLVATVMILMMMSFSVFAATTHLVKDGEVQNSVFINAGEKVDGTIQGPGNWTQLNLGDAAVDAPYLHIILKATGDTAPAQIVVSDAFTFNLSDLGITLTEEYQDVVLPVEEKGAEMLSWLNLKGLDGGSSVYTIKDIFLSDDAASTIAAAEPVKEEAPAAVTTAEDNVPKTGSDNTIAMVSMLVMAGSAVGLLVLKKAKKHNLIAE